MWLAGGGIALGVVLMALVVLASDALGFQRMGVLPGTSVMIPGNGDKELPAFCLDESAPAPTTADSLTQVLNSGSVSGVAEPPGEGQSAHARFNAVRINNLTSGPVKVRVASAVVLGGKSDSGASQMPFRYDVMRLLHEGETQLSVWRKLADCKAMAEARELASEVRDKLMDACLRQAGH